MSVSATGHLRAIGTKTNYANSAVMDAAYTISSGGAASLFADGFESNGFTAWTGTSGTPTIASTGCPKGTYCMNFPASSAKYAYWQFGTNPTNGATIYFRAYFTFSTLGADNGRIITLANSAWGQVMNLRFNGTLSPKGFTIQNVLGATSLNTTQTYSTATIYRIEGYWKLSHTAGQYELKTFVGDSGTPIETLTSGTTENTWASSSDNIQYFALGNPGAVASVGVVDDGAVGTAGYLGPGN